MSERTIMAFIWGALMALLLWVGLTTEGGADHYRPQRPVTTQQGESK